MTALPMYCSESGRLESGANLDAFISLIYEDFT